MRDFYIRYKRIINAVLLGFLPILICLLNLLCNGRHFSDLWLGQSQWNDELFYFKQIECMVKDTIPKGYFGYNESQALSLSFGAWSPVILMPWALFGKIFGWSYWSPFIANILYLTVAMILFGLFARPSWRQTLSIAVLFLIVTPLSRYMFSCMPEIICMAPLIVVIGLIAGYENSKHKRARFNAMLILLAVLTLIRPYFFVFFVFPFFIDGFSKGQRKFATIVAALISLVVYFVMSSRLNAPYFTDVYRTDWVDAFKNEGFVGGFIYLIKELLHYLYEIIRACAGGIRGGYPLGIYFAAFVIVIAEFLVLGIFLLIKKSKKAKFAWSMFLAQFAMLGAICLMYSLQDGFRHLLIFIVAGLWLSVFILDEKGLRRILLCVNCFALFWLFVVKASDPLYFGTVFNNDNEKASIASIQQFKQSLSEMSSTKEMSWDNDVALIFMDGKDGEEAKLIDWQYAYGLPEGFAVSLCEATYVSESDVKIKSRYVLTMSDGQVEKLLVKNNYKLVSKNTSVSLFENPSFAKNP